MKVTFNVAELAAELGVSRMTIYRMRQAGELPKPLGTTRRVTRWLRSDINLWIHFGCPRQAEFDRLKQTQRQFSKP